MTTEDDLQTAIDRLPDDWHTRLVLADWLDDHGDLRATGYRAIPAQRRRPLKGRNHGADVWWWHNQAHTAHPHFHNVVPADWYACLPPGVGGARCWPAYTDSGPGLSRRGCEDALALTFAALPADRQAELLKPAAPPAEG